jgi:hypothetical protein
MLNFVHRVPAARWLLPILVVILFVGHVCELPAYAELVSHHADESNGAEQLSSCDVVTATSSSGHSQVWAGLDMAVAVPVIDASPLRRTLQSFEDPARVPSRLALFLLHASLLI